MRRLSFLAGIGCALLVAADDAAAFTVTQNQAQTVDGQDFTFTFSNLPVAISPWVKVDVTLWGDYDATNEYANVFVETASGYTHQGSDTHCDSAGSLQTSYISSNQVADQQLIVKVNLSGYVGYSECTASLVRVTVSYTSLPDLTYTLGGTWAPASGSTAGHGSQFTVASTIYNLNENLTTDFYLFYYYCPTNANVGCTYLSNILITDNFTPGSAKYYTSPTLTMPATAEVGTRYIMFSVDATTAVTEANEANNVRFDPITVTTLPDLAFTGSTVPISGSTNTPGATFTGQYTVAVPTNTSAVNTDFVVAYEYCPTCLSTTGCIALGTQTITQNIQSGASHIFTSPTLTIPASATTGYHCIRAVLDSTAAVGESNEGNNTSWDTIYVGAGALPDLSADNLVVPSSGSVANAGATFTMKNMVLNNAAVGFTTDFNVSYYYCPSNTTTGCIYLATQLVTNDLAANGSVAVYSPTLTMPAAATVGTHYIRVFVDANNVVAEASETNNNSFAAINVTAKPDLTIAAVTVPFSGDTTGPGSVFTGRFAIQNKASTSAFSTDFDVEFFYCPSNTATGCVSLGISPITSDFLSGSSLTFTSGNLTIPGTATPGTHYIRAFVDSKLAIDEADELNNNTYAPITVTTGAADIYVKTFTATASGTTVSYTVETCNKGGATTTPILIGLFYNRAANPTCSDTAEDSYTITAGLAASACDSHVFTRTGAAGGTTTPRVMADQGCALAETDEANNFATATVTVISTSDGGVTPPDSAIKSDAKFEAGVLPDKGPTGDGGVKPDASQNLDTPAVTGDNHPAGETDNTSDGHVTPSADKGTSSSGGGCSCTMEGSDHSAMGLLLGLMVAAAVLVLRRRRR